jgi:anti-anti-sigma regulatory factor
VVAHAYHPDRDGELGLHAQLRGDGSLTCRVQDDGLWREPHSPRAHERSPMRGLAMTKALVDHLELEPGRGADGTVATFTQRLSRPARLLTRPIGGPAPTTQRRQQHVEVEQSEDGLVVRGEVDAGGAGTLRGLLLGEMGGGSLPAVVDLAGVTHLGSAGVQVLHVVAGEGSGVRLRAPYGSVAQHVLSLAQLPFEG